MNQLRTSLLIEGDASGLKGAVGQANTAMQALVNQTTNLGRGFKAASDSADVFEREATAATQAVKSLRSGLDPLYGAQQRAAAAELQLTKALQLGSISAREHDQVLALVRQEYLRTETAIKAMGTQMAGSFRGMGSSAHVMQNVSYQLQDVIVQASMGTSVFRALGQQAPQLLGSFGAVGAVMGVVAAAAFPLIGMFTEIGTESEKAGERVSRLQNATNAYTSAVEVQGRSLAELVKQYGALADEAERAARAETARTERALRSTIVDTTRGLRGQVGASSAQSLKASAGEIAILTLELERLEQQMLGASAGTISTFAIQMEDLRGKIEILGFPFETLRESMGLTESQTIQLADALERLEQAQSFETQVQALQEIQDLMVQVNESQRGGTQATIEMEEEIAAAVRAILALQAGAEGAGGALGGAANEASRMANEIARAVSNMQSLAAAGISSLRESEIRLANKGDPVATAGALERERFNAASAGIRAYSDRHEIAELDRQAEAHARNAEATERNRQELLKWQRAQTAAAKGGSGGTGSRGGAGGNRNALSAVLREIERDMDRLAPSYARDVEQLNAWRENALAQLDPAREGYDAFASDVEFIFAERLKEAYEQDLERRSDWAAGIERGLNSVNDELMTWADLGQNLFEEWSKGGEDAFVKLNRTGKFEIGDLVDYTLEQFARLAYQKAVQPAVSGLFDGLSGILGGLFGGATKTSHTGSIFGASNPQRTVNSIGGREQLALVTKGQGIFTPRQMETTSSLIGALASVAARPVASAGGELVLTVNQYGSGGGGSVDARQNGDGSITLDLDKMIDGKVAAAVADPQSRTHNTIRRTFGTTRSYGRGNR